MSPFIPPGEKILSGAEPIFHQGDKGIGLLFLHGFTGSPYEGRPFSEYFARRGYTVFVPLLPGHGTHPRDLLSVSWQDWYRTAVQAHHQLQESCRKVVVCGQSMGGALAINLAAHHPVDALIGLAAATYLSDWRLKLLPVARYAFRYQYKSRGPDIRSPQAKKESIHYNKYPLRSVLQLLALLEHVRGDLLDITAPVLLFHSRRDHVVPYGNLQLIATNVSSSVVQTVTLEESYHVISVDVEREKVFARIEAFLQEVGICAGTSG